MRERERAEQGSDVVDETQYNAWLRDLLEGRLPRWSIKPSGSKTTATEGRKEPDTIAVAPDGVPVVIEAKYGLDGNWKICADQAKAHIGRSWNVSTTIEQSVAVLYPEYLKRIDGNYKAALSEAQLEFASWRHSPGDPVRFPETGWLSGGLDELADFIEITAISEQRSADLIEEFSGAVKGAANILNRKFPGVAKTVKQEPSVQTDQMVSALLLNALLVHYQVASHHPEIKSPTDLASDNRATKLHLLKEWERILDINYEPIFIITYDVLGAIDDEKTANNLLKFLIEIASPMASANAHTIQNLAGQVFGKLLPDRKFLASFYTLPPSAALLAELAVARLPVDWSDPSAVTGLRVADFACGSGTLLSAVYGRIAARVRRQGVEDSALHARMLQDVFVGCDIMPAAVHITAATLSSVHPQVNAKTETHVMPYGRLGEEIKIGSLDLLEVEQTGTLFGDGSRSVDRREQQRNAPSLISVPHGSCDLVIMNPPYGKPTNHKLAERQGHAQPQFAAFGIDKATQKKMGDKIKKIAGQLPVSIRNGYAGQGTDFFDLAHLKVKPGGVVAFVLSAAFDVGTSWRKMRELIVREYENICVISSSAGMKEDRSFSSNTELGEVLLVATRRYEPTDDSTPEEEWRWANLRTSPKTTVEAVALAVDIESQSGDGVSEGKLGDQEWGFSVPYYPSTADESSPSVSPLMMSNPDITTALLQLTDLLQPGLNLPRTNSFVPLPITRLGYLGTAGPGHRKLKDRDDKGVFNLFPHPSGKTDFPVLWNHEHTKETRLVVHPDKHGRPKLGKESQAPELWKTATRLHFNLDFRFTSQPLAACLTPERVLGGTAWPSFMLHPPNEPVAEKLEWIYPMVLWANTTLGVMSFYITGSRTQVGRSRITISRLPELPVLDIRKLNPQQLRLAKTIFDRFRHREFMPANQSHQDQTRHALDQAVLTELLEFDQDVLKRVAILRDQWCREPRLH